MLRSDWRTGSETTFCMRSSPSSGRSSRSLSAEAHNWLGVAILEKGDFTGSIAEFRKTIALDPKYTRAYANLGSALTRMASWRKNWNFQTAVAWELEISPSRT